MKTTKYLAPIAALIAMILSSCGTTATNTFANISKPVAKGSSSSSASASSSHTPRSTTVRKGMTRDQVTAILGSPHRKQTRNEREMWFYTGGNKGEMMARGFASNFVPVVGPIVAYAGAEVRTERITVTFIGSRVTNVDKVSESAPVLKGAFAGL